MLLYFLCYFVSICSYSTGKSPGHASRCHEVIQAQCLDDDTEQAQLLRVLRDIVSAVKSQQVQPGSGLNIYVLSHGGQVFGQREPLDETVLRLNPPKIFPKRGNTHTLFQFFYHSDP